ncbi:MAG: alginate export family protein [Planctomycetaceae bacterium]
MNSKNVLLALFMGAACLTLPEHEVQASEIVQAHEETQSAGPMVSLVKHESCGDDCLDSCVVDSCVEGCCPDELFCDVDKPFLRELDSLTFGKCDWKGTAGLELRYRYLHETNRLRPPGPGLSSYDQWRFMPYASITYRDTITGYVEAIDAATFGEDMPLLPIDENRTDLLQYYVDVKVAELSEGNVNFRYGRQTLIYGDQHVISTLTWANTMRNFEGFRSYYKGGEWDIDAFAVQPVNGASRGTVFKTQSFDTPDQSEWVSGVYATYRGLEQGTLDLFWIWDVENEPVSNRQDGDRHSFGARYYGSKAIKNCCDEVERTWAYDLQGAIQIGNDMFNGTAGPSPSLNVYSGFFNAQLSHTWNKPRMKPQVFALYYMGTGDKDPTDSRNTTYFSLYPLGHAYWGILDNFSGENLVDYSMGSKLNPSEKLTLTGQFHWFDKHRREDFIYNIGGVPQGPRSTDPGGTNDVHIGNELDLIATYKVNKNLTLETGYSWFWYGGAVTNTALSRDDARQFYFLANYKF